METMLIEVHIPEIYEEVAKTMAYAGKKAEEEGAFARFFTTDSDREMLNRFWEESAQTVSNALRKDISACVMTPISVQYVFSIVPNHHEGLTDVMTTAITSYLVNSICSKWLSLFKPEESARYQAMATEHMEHAKTILSHRERPTRPRYE